MNGTGAMNLPRKVLDLSDGVRFHRRKWKGDSNSLHDVFESLISSVFVAWNVQIHALARNNHNIGTDLCINHLCVFTNNTHRARRVALQPLSFTSLSRRHSLERGGDGTTLHVISGRIFYGRNDSCQSFGDTVCSKYKFYTLS